MKIVQVIPTLDPRTGGPPMVALNLAAAIAARQHEVHILCVEDPAARDTVEKSIAAVAGADRVTYHRLPPAGKFAKITGRHMANALGAIDEVNLAHLHGVWESEILVTGRAARRRAIPYILTPHGMLDPWSLSQKKLKKQIALALVYRSMLNGAAAIHALNPTERDLFGPLGLTPPVEIVPNGFNLEALRPMPEPGGFRATHRQVGDRPFFFFMSRLHYKKGLDLLAEAYAAYRKAGGGFDLVIAGPDDGAEADLKQRIARHDLTDHAHVVGPIYGKDKLNALCDASCFVLPSRQEGFSIAITEALACGLPVIITESCHFPEVAEVEAGITTPLEVPPITEAMHQIENDPASAKAMGQRGRELVESRFTWDAIAEKMLAVYEKYAR